MECEKADNALMEQEKVANMEIEEKRNKKVGGLGRIWEIRKRVIGTKKTDTIATAIVDPKTGRLVS